MLLSARHSRECFQALARQAHQHFGELSVSRTGIHNDLKKRDSHFRGNDAMRKITQVGTALYLPILLHCLFLFRYCQPHHHYHNTF